MAHLSSKHQRRFEFPPGPCQASKAYPERKASSHVPGPLSVKLCEGVEPVEGVECAVSKLSLSPLSREPRLPAQWPRPPSQQLPRPLALSPLPRWTSAPPPSRTQRQTFSFFSLPPPLAFVPPLRAFASSPPSNCWFQRRGRRRGRAPLALNAFAFTIVGSTGAVLPSCRAYTAHLLLGIHSDSKNTDQQTNPRIHRTCMYSSILQVHHCLLARQRILVSSRQWPSRRHRLIAHAAAGGRTSWRRRHRWRHAT